MKAWKVTDTQGCDLAEVVFADTRSQAKTIAHGSEWFCPADYIDLRAIRAPKWDDLFDHCGPGRARFDDPVVIRRAREMGWHEYDGSYQKCEICGLYEWEELPESKINGKPGEPLICAACTGQRSVA